MRRSSYQDILRNNCNRRTNRRKIIKELMDNLKISDNQQPQKRQSCSVLLLRWFIGGLAGCINGLILFSASEAFFPPILGPITGQEELFGELIYLVSNNYSSWCLVDHRLVFPIAFRKPFSICTCGTPPRPFLSLTRILRLPKNS